MKQLLSKFAILVLISLCLSSCYYTSPVPLASVGRLPEKGLQGTWELVTAEGDNATYTLHLYDKQDAEGYNGDLTIEGVEEGQQTVDFYRLTVFITQVKGVGIVNIGLNTGQPDGEYLFAKYVWDQDKLKVFYVSEDAFETDDEHTTYFTDITTFRKRFEDLLLQDKLFKETPVVFVKTTKNELQTTDLKK